MFLSILLVILKIEKKYFLDRRKNNFIGRNSVRNFSFLTLKRFRVVLEYVMFELWVVESFSVVEASVVSLGLFFRAVSFVGSF